VLPVLLQHQIHLLPSLPPVPLLLLLLRGFAQGDLCLRLEWAGWTSGLATVRLLPTAMAQKML
jgi:hypothetical protein